MIEFGLDWGVFYFIDDKMDLKSTYNAYYKKLVKNKNIYIYELFKFTKMNPNERRKVNCIACGELMPHHAKEMCFKCYKKNWKSPVITCKNCGKERPHKAFGLCGSCHIKLHHYEKTKEHNYRKYHNISVETYKRITKECKICGFDNLVELHHIDENHSNNSEENMIGLCPNHHKLIHDMRFKKEILCQLKEKLKNDI